MKLIKIGNKYHSQYTQRFTPHQRLCEIKFDAERIDVRVDNCKPALLRRVADELEAESLCAYTTINEETICLMNPDYGMFMDETEFKAIVSELFSEQNYEITYID